MPQMPCPRSRLDTEVRKGIRVRADEMKAQRSDALGSWQVSPVFGSECSCQQRGVLDSAQGLGSWGLVKIAEWS